MINIDGATIEKTALATLAKELLEKLTPDARDAILTRSVIASLDDFSYKQKVGAAVGEVAVEEVRVLLQSPEWRQRIRESLQAGFDRYLQKLEVATERMLMETFHGRESSYGAYGRILSFWPDKPKDE